MSADARESSELVGEEQDGDAFVLHQFPFSHFNEKARWGLDFKRIPHARKSYLPGPHAGAIHRLSGQSSTPVLTIGERVVAGSAEILRVLEELFPDPPLLPTEAEARAEALALQTRYDGEFGPAVRTAIFSVMLLEPGYMCGMFSSPQPTPLRWLYRGVFPLARGKVERAYRTDDLAHVDACRSLVERTLDEIAVRVQATGYLVGDSFTIADLTAAALLAPVADPDHPDMRRPSPQPRRLEEFVEPWHSHPASDWARAMYAAHRPTSPV